jgi:hypothetical protein
LSFMLLRSPQWLFLYPGLLIAALGLLGSTMLTMGPIQVPGVLVLDINSLLYFSVAGIVGVQIAFFGLFAVAFARKMQLRIAQGFPERVLRAASNEIAIAVGACLVLGGIAGAIYAVLQWGHSSFGALVPSEMMRITIPSVTSLAIGTQILFGGFMLGFIEIE